MLSFFKKQKMVLGMNSRNLEYIRPYNSGRTIRLADNKLLTKKTLQRAGLPVSRVFAVIKNQYSLLKFDWQSLPPSFTLKPNRGLGGKGILIVYSKKNNRPSNGGLEQPTWIKADRSQITVPDIQNHILNILEGTFAINNLPDTAFFEERIKIIKLLKPYSFRGIPDIRIIVYSNVPVMAELRLPTEESGGRANLHMGGIGVGIDLGTGITTSAIQHDHPIDYVPKTRLILSGIKLPFWRTILEMAVTAQQASKLKFAGVDIAIDRDQGPIILELNARPGLAIQIANLAPLKERLERVRGLKIKSANRGARLSGELFGGEVEEELEEISGRKIIGIYEKVKIIYGENQEYSLVAKIDSGAYRSAICQTLIDKLNINQGSGRIKTVRSSVGQEERPIVPLKFILDNQLIESEVFIADRSQMKFDIIIGRRDLQLFLIDPTKNLILARNHPN